ncbi:MAG TPA: mechanosensitive ion channel family protein [Cyclobacteriaceae bacterium]|nr:mechanosensitive ion channel family protein [Cyclobacteriaceae bacterium]HMV08824.1 mechanosensitive ion channel family protein [Cyclobacteriaceae bacterium]HMV90758.1 mechanosensitive ion channel family protein [Cyclobacteriaceae bacterium]HMW99970.1 mechanosensitive ion channel family protein [Cyclobacteriaceae bacterium]HMX49167.1 mechanosensitive ion channel family protein [Cyclobacteriaceae bacterium]
MFGLMPGSIWESVVFALVVLAVAMIISRILKFVIDRFVKTAALKLKVDHTRYKFFKNATDFVIYLIATVVIFRSIPSLRTYGNTLLASAGVLAAIVGFASQSAFSNIISGIFLVIFRPFSVGDRVQIGQLYTGDVEDITLRHTVIRNFENRLIVIPNSVINNETIINSTLQYENVCVFVELTIAFNSDTDKAINIIRQEAENHPETMDNRTEEDKEKGEPKVSVRVINLTEFGQQIRAYVWAKDPSSGFNIKTDLFRSIKKQFDAQGIEIPYRTVYMKELPV